MLGRGLGIDINRYNIRYISMPAMGETTVLVKASSKFDSLRTTVPMSIVKQWKLKEGDKFDWEWKAIDNEMVLVLRKQSK